MKPSELNIKELEKVGEFSNSKGYRDGEEFLNHHTLHSLEEMYDEELVDYIKGEYHGADEMMGFTEAINHIIEEQNLSYTQISDDLWIGDKPNPTRWVVLHNQHGGIIKEVIAYCDSRRDAEKWIADLELEGTITDDYEIATEGGI